MISQKRGLKVLELSQASRVTTVSLPVFVLVLIMRLSMEYQIKIKLLKMVT